MTKNILVPTDGTELCAKSAAYAVQLAKALGAKVTAVTVTAPAHSIMIGEVKVVSSADIYEKHAEAQAAKTLGVVADLAKSAGVACDVVHMRHEQPWHGILDAAKSKAADMIVMASHGRRGLSAMLIGSETQKVITNSSVPVLVYKP